MGSAMGSKSVVAWAHRLQAVARIVCLGGAVVLGSAGWAQTAAEKAQEAIGIYASIIAVSGTCGLELGRDARDSLEANIKLLAARAGLGERELETIAKDGTEKAGARKAEICRMDVAAFNRFVTMQLALAAEAGSIAGVPLAAVPGASTPPPPLAELSAPALPLPPGLVPEGMLQVPADPAIERARQMLIASHLVEAVSDECEIDLTDDETLALEKAQAYFRGRIGASEAQINMLTDLLEAKIEKSRRDFCTPRFDFRAMLKGVIEAVQ